jgi:hypothetical protein
MHVSADEMAEFAGAFDAPLMFQQGLELQPTDPEGAARYFSKALENQHDYFPARLALARTRTCGFSPEWSKWRNML